MAGWCWGQIGRVFFQCFLPDYNRRRWLALYWGPGLLPLGTALRSFPNLLVEVEKWGAPNLQWYASRDFNLRPFIKSSNKWSSPYFSLLENSHSLSRKVCPLPAYCRAGSPPCVELQHAPCQVKAKAPQSAGSKSFVDWGAPAPTQQGACGTPAEKLLLSQRKQGSHSAACWQGTGSYTQAAAAFLKKIRLCIPGRFFVDLNWTFSWPLSVIQIRRTFLIRFHLKCLFFHYDMVETQASRRVNSKQ